MALAICVSTSALAHAQPTEEVAAARDAAAPVDEGIPGPFRTVHPVPARAAARACSFREPVCVEPEPGTPPETTLALLDRLERAWATLRGPLRTPPPSPSPEQGGAFVLRAGPGGAPSVVEPLGRDPRTRVDRGITTARVDATLMGCAQDLAVARALIEATRFAHAPAMDEGSATAQVAAWLPLLTPCASEEPLAAGEFQAHADRAIARSLGTTPGYARGAATFYSWLDETRGVAPGAVLRALWALSATMSTPGAARLRNEPDTFDVLGATFTDPDSPRLGYDALLLDFAVARSLPRSETMRPWPSRATLLRGTPLRPEWDIPWPRTPRSLSPLQFVEPTGTSVVRVRTEGRSPSARLRVEVSWEEHARFRLALVRVDGKGTVLGRNDVPAAHKKDTSAQFTQVSLDGAESVFVVLTNAGDPAYSFDPDDGDWEPHSYVLNLAEE